MKLIKKILRNNYELQIFSNNGKITNYSVLELKLFLNNKKIEFYSIFIKNEYILDSENNKFICNNDDINNLILVRILDKNFLEILSFELQIKEDEKFNFFNLEFKDKLIPIKYNNKITKLEIKKNKLIFDNKNIKFEDIIKIIKLRNKKYKINLFVINNNYILEFESSVEKQYFLNSLINKIKIEDSYNEKLYENYLINNNINNRLVDFTKFKFKKISDFNNFKINFFEKNIQEKLNIYENKLNEIQNKLKIINNKKKSENKILTEIQKLVLENYDIKQNLKIKKKFDFIFSKKI